MKIRGLHKETDGSDTPIVALRPHYEMKIRGPLLKIIKNWEAVTVEN